MKVIEFTAENNIIACLIKTAMFMLAENTV